MEPWDVPPEHRASGRPYPGAKSVRTGESARWSRAVEAAAVRTAPVLGALPARAVRPEEPDVRARARRRAAAAEEPQARAEARRAELEVQVEALPPRRAAEAWLECYPPEAGESDGRRGRGGDRQRLAGQPEQSLFLPQWGLTAGPQPGRVRSRRELRARQPRRVRAQPPFPKCRQTSLPSPVPVRAFRSPALHDRGYASV